MASCWGPHLLALEVWTTTRQAQGGPRSSAADARDELGKSFLGRSSHPWRAPQARHRCRPDFGCQVHGPTPAPTVAGLENVPPEPCRWDRLDRLFVVPTISLRLLYGLLVRQIKFENPAVVANGYSRA